MGVRHEELSVPEGPPAEISKERLEALGFSPAGGCLLYAATARASSRARGLRPPADYHAEANSFVLNCFDSSFSVPRCLGVP